MSIFCEGKDTERNYEPNDCSDADRELDAVSPCWEIHIDPYYRNEWCSKKDCEDEGYLEDPPVIDAFRGVMLNFCWHVSPL